MFRMAMVALCGIALVISAVGCGETRPAVSDTPVTEAQPSQEPIWVSSPARAFPELANEVFFGVGVGEAKRLPGVYLRRKSSIERGRAEVAGQLRTFVTGVFKDYTEAAFTPSMDVAESRSLTSNVQKSILDETLMGAKTHEIWKDPTTGDYYALVILSMDSVAQQLRQKIQEVEKGRLRIAADEAHKELDDIIAKNRARAQ